MTIRIVGEGLDALIFASNLAIKKINFQWLLNSNRVGGYFAGALNCIGEPIDLGMVLLEPNTYDTEQTTLTNFQGQFGYQARPFIHDAYKLIYETLGSSSKVIVKSQLGGTGTFPDYFISDQLDAFEMLSEVARLELKERIDKLGTEPHWHPSHKNEKESPLGDIGIADYLQRVYGEALYGEYFEGYLTNFLGEFINKLPANSHRRAWLPLLWPETIYRHIHNPDLAPKLFSPIFEKPDKGSIAKWVKGMREEVQNFHGGEVITSPHLVSEILGNLDSERNFLFVNSEKIPKDSSTAEGSGQAVSISLRMVHFCSDMDSNEVVFLSNCLYGCFRYSTAVTTSGSRGGVTFEFGQNTSELSDEKVILSALAMCREIGIHPTCQGTVFQGKLPISIESETTNSEQEISVANYQTLHNSKSTSVNDNIIRGTWAIKRMSEIKI